MLCVKTFIGKSEISGIGLFAAELIAKNAIVWKFDSTIDILLTDTQLKSYPFPVQKQLNNYTFLDPYYKKHMLCGDDARFFNHSDNNNCDDSQKDITIALRDIKIGEELTINYNELVKGIRKKL